MRDKARSSLRSATPPFVPIAVAVSVVAQATLADSIVAACRRLLRLPALPNGGSETS